MNRALTRVAAVAVGLLSLAASSVQADPLAELNDSPQMHRFLRNTSVDSLYTTRYFKPGTNYASVFVEGEGHLELQSWLSPNEGGFDGGHIQGQKTREYIEARRTFTSEKTGDIQVRVIVPHPKYISMIEYGLIRVFKEIEPPLLEVTNEETIDIRGNKATLYMHSDKGCSLKIHSARASVIQLMQTECVGLHHLVTLAEALDIRRFERKLDS